MEAQSRSSQSFGQRCVAALFAPVDAAGVVFFRIAFYAIVAWQAWRFIDHQWVELFYINKPFYFTYWPFDFVRPWPGKGMYIHLWALFSVALCAMLGLFYRLSASLCFVLFTYVFLLEKARYINHVYLTCLLTFLMIFIPTHRTCSLDALRKPEWRSDVAPAWALWLIRFQIGLPYFWGGIAKINADWLRCEPLRAWLAARTDFPLIGPLFIYEPVVWIMTYGSFLLDLLAVFLLSHRRTRVFWYIGLLTFHFMNSRLFGIGIFPWLMIPATLVFFEPDWPRRIWRDFQGGVSARIPRLILGAALGFLVGAILPGYFSLVQALVAAFGVAIAVYHLDEPFQPAEHHPASPAEQRQPAGLLVFPIQHRTVVVLGMWVVVQTALPLRHFFIPGNVHWTEEGHNYSWHMKLRDKDSSGFFLVKDTQTGEERTVYPQEYLTQVQAKKMLSRPHMIVPFAHFLAEQFRKQGQAEVEVRARIMVSLNGRTPQLMIDPQVDLAKVAYPWWRPAKWILPLEVPLETAWRKTSPVSVRRMAEDGED